MTAFHHTDVIGSLLRPHHLSQAQAALAAGQLAPADFKRIEDRAVDQAIAMQEGCGLDVITDGELRRFSFLDHLLGDVDGFIPQPGATIVFHGNEGTWEWAPPVTVNSKIKSKRKITVEEYAYARARAHVPVKVTLISPLILYTAWNPQVSTAGYRDAYELFRDAAAIIRDEIVELARLGCTYVQIDSPDLGTLVDPENRTLREGLGMPTQRTLTEGIEILNSIADVPGVTFGLHLCKGNNQSMWIATGGYDFIAESVFGGLSNFDVFLLEYDDQRSGGFEPLAKVPDDKSVVLGLITNKTGQLESVPDVVSRINEAARYVGKERLGVSTQCGFAPVSAGPNHLSEEDQERKLELVAQVAHEVW
ncbi:MAG: cobalamin-independent methionine synthase II family protein [Actinobacteria bacterium]|nr:cobalamin-independent methionine synthase II family protein [Actinomycetota bacterium]